jgi:hypothetical protein
VKPTAWGIATLLSVCLGYPSRSDAQAPPSHEDWAPRRGTSHVFGLGYQSPDGPVFSTGLIVGTVPGKANKCIFGATSEGLLVQGHVGLAGPKLSVGLARYNPGFGYGAKLSALHLWRRSGDAPAGMTYIGPEAEVSILVVRVNAGILWRTAGPRGSSPRFTWGAGIGF